MLSDETKEDLRLADLGEPTNIKFLKALFLYPQFHVVWKWKLARKLWRRGPLSRALAKIIRAHIFNRGCILPLEAKIGKRIRLVHPLGVCIGINCEIGDDCTIFEFVTMGRNDDVKRMPKIGNNVTIFIKAHLQGGITVGDNAIIGAGAVVTKDVPKNAIVVGNPARVLKYVSQDKVGD